MNVIRLSVIEDKWAWLQENLTLGFMTGLLAITATRLKLHIVSSANIFSRVCLAKACLPLGVQMQQNWLYRDEGQITSILNINSKSSSTLRLLAAKFVVYL